MHSPYRCNALFAGRYMYLNGYSDLVQLKNICPRFLDMKIVVEYMSSM